MRGMITEIQRFSLNDGPGIRTTVFFKGCDMKCSWCHNPETLEMKPQLMFYSQKCIGCGHCFTECKTGAHYIDDSGAHKIDRLLCNSCGKCAEACYAQALVMCGKEMSVDEVMFEIEQDKPYYENSGGGVTLSGGEVLMQKEFAEEIADACHQKGIKIAVESNISLPFEEIEPLFSKMDFIMCDLKIFDEDRHRKYIGIGNSQILKNIKAIDGLGIPMIVRTPLIPGATDSVDNIREITKYLSGIKNLTRYEMLNFNPLGASKYDGLNYENAFKGKLPLDKTHLEALKNAALENLPVVKVV